MNNGAGKPIVALDIDGSLGDYHGHFIRFAEGWLDCELPSPERENPGVPLSEFLGLERRVYREIKLAYRQGGLKRTMPAYPGASGLTSDIRQSGAEVWICTTRPYMRLDNIDPDTREWLRRNGIEYDGVIFDTLEGKGSKYQELYRQVGDRVAWILEDMPEYVAMARRWFPLGEVGIGLKDQPYNRYINHATLPWAAHRVTDLRGCYRPMRHWINDWKARNTK